MTSDDAELQTVGPYESTELVTVDVGPDLIGRTLELVRTAALVVIAVALVVIA